jgi:tRNA 2-thiouridine synthesizing protein A
MTLELIGEVCPYTYVRTKLALEDLAEGALLTVVVDHPAARENVPRSARAEGHEVLSVEEAAAGRWAIVIRRGPEAG